MSMVGSLAGTLTWEEEVAGTFEFRLRNLRSDSVWSQILFDDHSNLDLAVVGELNVLVSAGVRAMCYMYARAAGIQYRSIPLTAMNEVPVAAAWPAALGAAPNWWAVYSPFLNGQPWLYACTYEVLRLTNMRTRIETGVPDAAAMPNHVLAWDDFTMSLDLDEAVLHELVANRRTLFLPRLDLTWRCSNGTSNPAREDRRSCGLLTGISSCLLSTPQAHPCTWCTIAYSTQRSLAKATAQRLYSKRFRPRR